VSISDLTTWLKTTIPGIIILGAAGSILAVFILKLAGRLILPPLKGVLWAVVKAVTRHFVAPAAAQLVRLHLQRLGDNNDNKFHLFYTLQLMKLAFALTLAGCSFVLFAIEASQSVQELFRVAVVAPLIVFFLAVWYGFRCMVIVLVPFYFDVEHEIQDALRKARARKAEAESEAKPDAPSRS